MELRDLRTFLRAAELGSFTKAADDLSYAQSTVTMQIQKLEGELGFPLFERIGRKTALTSRGKEIADLAVQMLQIESRIESIGRTSPSDVQGTLRIGVVESIMRSLLLDIIGGYRELYPNVSISIFPAVTVRLFDLLRRNEVDIVFTIGHMADVEGCVRLCCHPERAIFAAPTGHVLAQREALTLREVLSFPLIEIGRNTFLQQELYKKAAEHGCRPISYIQSESSGIIIDLVRQGLGIAFLPEYLLRRAVLETGGLRILSVVDFHIPFYIHAWRHENKWMTPQMAGIVELTKSYWERAGPEGAPEGGSP
ncbi:MAG: LysR family transcriptional regulator [Synergistaceae bacterium]|nr:LysR family transcriptional regulator [Synergistaceae bacterium]